MAKAVQSISRLLRARTKAIWRLAETESNRALCPRARSAVAHSIVMGIASLLCASASSQTVDGFAKVSDDLTLHYQTAGTGNLAVVFIPGWTMTTRVFEHQMTRFQSSTQYKAVTFDPRAQGLSTITIEGHYYEQHARDLHALLVALNISRFVLIGWSSGGGDALEYVRLFGAGNLAGLVLLDTSPKARATDYTKTWAWFGTLDEGDQDNFLRSFSYDVLIDRTKADRAFATWMLDDPSEANIQFVEEMSRHTPNSIAALLNTSYWYLDNTEQVRALDGRVPLLYLTRQEWHDMASQWAQKNTPAAQVISFGKHMMFWEHPERFNAILDTFLKTTR